MAASIQELRQGVGAGNFSAFLQFVLDLVQFDEMVDIFLRAMNWTIFSSKSRWFGRFLVIC
jgi:hypothetical protein